MGVGEPKETTQLYADMSICAEILHCTHEGFEKLSRIEKKKLRLYVQVNNEKMKADMPKRDIVNNPPKIKGSKLETKVRNR